MEKSELVPYVAAIITMMCMALMLNGVMLYAANLDPLAEDSFWKLMALYIGFPSVAAGVMMFIAMSLYDRYMGHDRFVME